MCESGGENNWLAEEERGRKEVWRVQKWENKVAGINTAFSANRKEHTTHHRVQSNYSIEVNLLWNPNICLMSAPALARVK